MHQPPRHRRVHFHGNHFNNSYLMIRMFLALVPSLTITANSLFPRTLFSDRPPIVYNTVSVTDLTSSSYDNNDVESAEEMLSSRSRRSLITTNGNLTSTMAMILPRFPFVSGMSFQHTSDKKRVDYDRDGIVNILEGIDVTITLYGCFSENNLFKFSFDSDCNKTDDLPDAYPVNTSYPFYTGTVRAPIPLMGDSTTGIVYICLLNVSTSLAESLWVAQGDSHLTRIKLTTKLLPYWVHIIILIFLLGLSGLFSGLNLGLMSLNKTDLKIIMNTGTPLERKYAEQIAPVRNHGNFLLCSLLFSNVLVNASLTILVDELTSGLVAIVMSTLFIVIFGEIIPQAICSRYGLAVGARTIYITKFFMLITFPLAFPLSKVLDKFLGEEIGNVYNRERLKELLRVTKDHHGLEVEEVGIISGALDLKKKTVKDIMTNIVDVFMLPLDSTLKYKTMAEIEKQGFSRIPIYDVERSNVVALLNVKQLTLLDASDNIPLKTVVEFYQNQLFYVFENTRLDYMFKAFKEGNRGHMAFIQQINDEGPGDPYYETIGIVTMEDVLEELLQAEILDESDVGKLKPKTTMERKIKRPFHFNHHHRNRNHTSRRALSGSPPPPGSSPPSGSSPTRAPRRPSRTLAQQPLLASSNSI